MYKGFNRHEVLKEDYKKDISSWDWDGLKFDCEDYGTSDDPDETILSTFLGTVFAIMPSGKFYMPWTTNQTKHDIERDGAFYDALEEIAESHNMFIFSGEGDPCDLFVGFCV